MNLYEIKRKIMKKEIYLKSELERLYNKPNIKNVSQEK